MASSHTIPDHEITFPGYKLKENRFISEINADCFLLEHVKSGARILKIAADDPNKSFSIAFGTMPDSDTGTPHILEHAVLNGSVNFPVKSPFDVLSKGSLNTFLNAMTSDDFTIYPVASMNEADYFNLMHVYLDAVFNPMIYHDRRIFMQEGWHYELLERSAPLDYKGVVYNEMKGVFSNPEREMWYRIQQNLFADSNYRYASGGYPSAIPSLTYEDFLAFHKKYYQPSNSYIYFYGDADLKKELEFIDREYLSKINRNGHSFQVMPKLPFDEIKEISGYYSVMEGDTTDHQTYLSLTWVIGSGADPHITMALNILADIMVNRESAPIRKSLQEAGIGKDVYAACSNMFQNLFSIVVTNANPSDKDKFRKIIFDTLQKVCDEKINKDALSGTINRLEFRLREGNDAQKGLTFIMRCINSWIYTDNPFPSLEFEKLLDRIKGALTGTYLEDIVKKEMLDNPFGLVYVLEPLMGLENKIAAETTGKLASVKNQMSDEVLENLVRETRSLVTYQQEEDSPQALATIPFLRLKDIEPKAKWYAAVRSSIGNIPHLHYNDFTNSVIYMHFWFDLNVLPEEKIPYAALLTQLIGKLDAGEFGYEKLDAALNNNTGGFSSSLSTLLHSYNDNELLVRFRIFMKTTGDKLDNALNLLENMINRSDFDNTERLYELLKRHQSQVESSVTQNGFNVAATRLESYYSKRGLFVEKTRGIAYYEFVTDLTKRFKDNPSETIMLLKEAYHCIFSRNNLEIGVTCNEHDFRSYSISFAPFAEKLSGNTSVTKQWALDLQPGNEGIVTSSKVQYVIQGYNFANAGIPWNNKWHVLNQILSTDWLQTQVRVIGGAYGGYSYISRNGSFYFASYRDPNLIKTLNTYKATADYLEQFSADADAMTRYIIGTIANLDYPLTPAEKGDQAFRWHFEGVTAQDIQSEREDVLSATMDDIRNMSGVIRNIMDKQVYCVYGNEEQISMNKEIFRKLIRLNLSAE